VARIGDAVAVREVLLPLDQLLDEIADQVKAAVAART
jgi:hypothetical protein